MIITSMLDNDLYKFTMQQAVLHQHSGAMVEYLFKCRTENVDFRPYEGDIIKNVNRMCRDLRFTKEDLEYLGDLRFFRPDYLYLLKQFKFDYDFINIKASDNGELHINIKGPWLQTILFEVPVLSIVSEVYSTDMSQDYELANERTVAKAELIKEILGLIIAEFGGRRRHSVMAHDNGLIILKKRCPGNLIGTSNVMMAKKHSIKAVGTMAHEWLQAHQALYRIEESQFMAFENWAKEYRGDLGIALSDVIGLKYFLYDFDMYFSKLFDGTRHDSGDPYTYANALIHHYKSMNIDPKTKSVVFSDGLDFETAIKLYKTFYDQIGVSFGIGTYITNDFDYKALQIVLKMIMCNGRPVAKKSDSPGKGMCTDHLYMDYLERAFDKRISG